MVPYSIKQVSDLSFFASANHDLMSIMTIQLTTQSADNNVFLSQRSLRGKLAVRNDRKARDLEYVMKHEGIYCSAKKMVRDTGLFFPQKEPTMLKTGKGFS